MARMIREWWPLAMCALLLILLWFSVVEAVKQEKNVTFSGDCVMTNQSLFVGQKLWYAPSYLGGSGEEVIVTKIGRKWATVGEGSLALKINSKTWAVDGGKYISSGTCYASKAAYDAELRLQESWKILRVHILRSYLVPDGFTQETVDQLAKQFGLVEVAEVKQ